jgi:LysM repeat protein
MSDNHTHDRDLLVKVDRLLNDGQPSGDALLDELAAAQPQPRPAFQQVLENRLMTAYHARPGQHTQQEDNPMSITQTGYAPVVPRQSRLTVPLTLAAVVAVTFIAGSALLFMNSLQPEPPGFGAQPAVTESPTAIPTATPIPNEFELTGTAIIVQATAYAREYWPDKHIIEPGDTLASVALRYGVALDTLLRLNQMAPDTPLEVGQTLLLPLAEPGRIPLEPTVVPPGAIPLDLTATPLPPTVPPPAGEQPYLTLRLALPFPASAAGQLQVGDRFRVAGELLYIARDETYRSMLVTLAEQSVVLAVNADGESLQAEIAVASEQERQQITALVDAGMPVLLVSGQYAVPVAGEFTRIPPAQLQPAYSTRVIIARDGLPAGTLITADMLLVTYWPEADVPQGITGEIDALAGQYAQTAIARWQPVLLTAVGGSQPDTAPVVTATPIG